MALIVSGVITMLTALSNHFVVQTQTFHLLPDYEWSLSGDCTPNEKANMVAGSMADIILYGSQMMAQIVHVLVNPSV
jgi:hypothetical protein